MADRKNSTDATLAAWKFADAFNRLFHDRKTGLDQLSPPLRGKAKAVLEATDNLRGNNGWIKDPHGLFELADSARGELEKGKFVAPLLATDSGLRGKAAKKSDGSFLILMLVVVCGGLLTSGYCSTQSRGSRSMRSRVHYVHPESP
jgi:hypothetical protein